MLFSPNESLMPDTPQLWAKIIREDLASSKALLECGQARNAVLLTSAALEKSIKMYLALSDNLSDEDATHNIASLAKKAGLLDRAPQKIKETFFALSRVHVLGSYPANDFVYGILSEGVSAKAAYNSACSAVRWVLKEAGFCGRSSGNV